MNNNESNDSIDVKKSVNCEENQCNIEEKLKIDENLSFGKSSGSDEEVVKNYKIFESNEMKDKKSEDKKIGIKDSFDDRICDDLCSVVLKYLSFRDKIRLECVSKQFQSYVYINQKVLSTQLTNDYDFNCLNGVYIGAKFLGVKITLINVKALEIVLSKCKAINSIKISRFSVSNHSFEKIFKQNEVKVIEIIIKYAYNLKEFSCDFNEIPDYLVDCLIERFGHSLEKLRLNDYSMSTNNNTKNKFAKSCPKLISAETFALKDLNEDKTSYNVIHLKKLTNIELYFDNDSMLLLNFYMTYKMQLKHIRISNDIGSMSRNDNTPMNYLFKFRNLEILEFNSIDINSDKLLDKFTAIGVVCEKMHTFIAHSCVVSFKFLTALSSLRNLKTLSITYKYFNSVPLNELYGCDRLRGCRKLRKLHLMKIKFKHNFFDNIDLYLPNLISIRFSDPSNEYSIQALKSISCLVNLKKLFIVMLFEKSIDVEINQLISNSKNLEIIQIDCLVNTSEESINKLFSIALENPKIRFEFNIDFEFNFESFREKFGNKPINILINN